MHADLTLLRFTLRSLLRSKSFTYLPTTNSASLSPSALDFGWKVVSGRRGYLPKIFLRHDIMKSVLARFLDSKGVPQDAADKVVATKHYYAFHKAEFEQFDKVVVWLSTVGLFSGEDLGSVLRRFPNFLWLDINLLESKMHWFLTELQFQRHEIGPLLAQNPNLLFHHAEDLGHFMQLLEMMEIRVDEIRELIFKDPGIVERCEDLEELQVRTP